MTLKAFVLQSFLIRYGFYGYYKTYNIKPNNWKSVGRVVKVWLSLFKAIPIKINKDQVVLNHIEKEIYRLGY